MKKIFLSLLILASTQLFAQNITISGKITDSISGEDMINATISSQKSFVNSNSFGFYSISVPTGKQQIVTTHFGYSPKQITENFTKDTVINFSISPQDIEIKQVTVKANRQKQNQYSLDITQANRMPTLLGEKDYIKNLLLLPGVTAGSEGSSNLYVRGGSADQNLILLDNVPVYNANHLFGFFSVFNSDALKSVTLLKGGIPARYNGRSSSVLDIYMKEGNLKKYEANISLGLLSSKATIEGPIIKNKSSFILSARRTYIDLLFRPFSKSIADNTQTGYYFWDLNFKINTKIKEKNRLFFSVYTGEDKGFIKQNTEEDNGQEYNLLKGEQNLGWGNITSSARWQSILSNKASLNTTISFSKFQFQTINDYYSLGIFQPVRETEKDTTEEKYYYSNSSGIQDVAIKTNLDYYLNQHNQIKIGAKAIYHEFYPSFTSESFSDNYTNFNIEKSTSQKNIYSTEFACYIEDHVKLGNWFNANFGANFNVFFVDNKLYKSLEPRILFDISLSPKTNIQTSYSAVNQYIHLLTNSSVSMPTDLWVPVTGKIKPIKSEIYDFGITYDNSNYLFSSSVFYKTGKNFIKYLPGVNLLEIETDWQDKVATGKGYSYGLELLAKKQSGKLTGWISYTYSRSFRIFEDINFGKTFPFKYDRPHNLNVVLLYNINKNISLSGNFVLMSGYNTTFAKQYYSTIESSHIQGGVSSYYDNINNLRTPIYHRADISINFEKQKKRGVRTWNIGIYNVYNRLNPYTLEMWGTGMRGISIFPFMPSISYSFKF